MSLELGELLIESSSGEALAEPVEDVVGGLSGVVEPGEFTAEDGCVEQSGLRRLRRRRRSGTRWTNGAPRRCPGRSSGIAGCLRRFQPDPDEPPCWGCTTPHLQWRI